MQAPSQELLWVVGSTITIGAALWAGISRITKIELRVNMMWDYMMDRAFSEAVVKGFRKNSPLQVSPEVRERYKPMMEDLKIFYRKIGHHLTDRELFIEVHRRFRDRLVEEVCIPLGLVAGSCILIAMHLAREAENEVEGG